MSIQTFFAKNRRTSLWGFIVLGLSLTPLPTTGSPSGMPLKDKLVHFIMYFLMSYFLLLDNQLRKRPLPRFWVFAFAFLFGVSMEVFQGLTGYRSADVLDALANSLGAIAGILLFDVLHPAVTQIWRNIRRVSR